MLYCFADHVALPSSFPGISKTNLGCCHAHTQTSMHGSGGSWSVMNGALVPTSPCRCMFKWRGLNLTIEMTGHSFLGHGAGYRNGLRWRRARWLMPHEDQQAALWRKKKENHPCHKQECWEDPGIVVLFANRASPYPLLPPDPCLKERIPLLIQLKWSYLSHFDISVISSRQCCWMRHPSKALQWNMYLLLPLC